MRLTLNLKNKKKPKSIDYNLEFSNVDKSGEGHYFNIIVTTKRKKDALWFKEISEGMLANTENFLKLIIQSGIKLEKEVVRKK